MPKKVTTEDFIERAKKVHGDKYSYDEVVYKDSRTKVKIYCNKCKKYFYQNPHVHLDGSGCQLCANKQYTTEEFIEKAIKIHGNKYDYKESKYINSYTKVKIYCNTCKEYFWQLPSNHLSGYKCQKCKFKYLAKKHSSNTEEFIEWKSQLDWLPSEIRGFLIISIIESITDRESLESVEDIDERIDSF